MGGGVVRLGDGCGQREEFAGRRRRRRRCGLRLHVAQWRLTEEQADAEARAEVIEQVEDQRGQHREQLGALASHSHGDLGAAERDDDLAFGHDCTCARQSELSRNVRGQAVFWGVGGAAAEVGALSACNGT